MAGLLTRRAVVLAKAQSAEGSAATLSPELNAILISDLNWNPQGEAIERNFLRDSLSPLPYRQGRKLAEATFGFELKGAPELGARAEWSPLMRAAGMSETLADATVTSIRTAALQWTQSPSGPTGAFYVDLDGGGDPSITNPQVVREAGNDMRRAATLASIRKGEFIYGDFDTLGFTTVYVMLSDALDPDTKALGYVETVSGVTSITYNFRDTAHEFVTVKIFRDGKVYSCVDGLIDITSIQYNAGAVPICQARLLANYATPADESMPTALYQTHLPPIAESMAFTLDGFSAGVIPAWSINYANQISERRDVNSVFGFKGNRYTGRAPVGQVTMEQELVAAFPLVTRWENATTMAWSAQLGTTPQKIEFSGPAVQVTNVTETDVNNGILGWQADLRYNAPGSVKEFQIKLL